MSPWRPTLAHDPDVSEMDRHEARLMWSPLPMRATAICETCGRRWTVVDEADELAPRVLGHAPLVTLRDQHGLVLGDGAEEQAAARSRWNTSWSSADGHVVTVSEAMRDRVRDRAAEIGARLFGDRDEEEAEHVNADKDQELDMSEEIRRRARAGSGLSRALGARFATDTGEESVEPSEEEIAARALEEGRTRIRIARGARRPQERPEESEPVDMSEAIRSAVRSRRRRTAGAFDERLFGDQEAGDAGGKE